MALHTLVCRRRCFICRTSTMHWGRRRRSRRRRRTTRGRREQRYGFRRVNIPWWNLQWRYCLREEQLIILARNQFVVFVVVVGVNNVRLKNKILLHRLKNKMHNVDPCNCETGWFIYNYLQMQVVANVVFTLHISYSTTSS